MDKDYKMGTDRMTKHFEMPAARNLPKLTQIPRTSLVCINYAYSKTVCKFFPHHFCDLITALLMVATTGTSQCLHKISVDITFR